MQKKPFTIIKLLFLLSFFILGCSKQEEKIIKKSFQKPKTECELKFENFKGKNFENLEERKWVLLFSKAQPVIFIRRPMHANTSNKKILKLRKSFEELSNPWSFLLSIEKGLKYNQKQNRDLFLREGYLYTENKNAAYTLSQFIKIEYLFLEDALYINRGSEILTLEKKSGAYFFSNGSLKGQRASVLVFDRISNNIEDLEKPLHIDINKINEDYKISKLENMQFDEKNIVADHEGQRLIFSYENGIKLECGSLEKNNINIGGLKRGIIQNVNDRLPFDEPLHEFGEQLDGKLRPAWLKAYRNKKKDFRYNGDKYFVYNDHGKPIPPEVCVDFIVDSIDRAAGSWFSNYKRTSGSFDFSLYGNIYSLRNVNGFKSFVLDYPDLFELFEFNDKIELSDDRFYQSLIDKKLKVGDIVFIKGPTPWDKIEEHSHSFFVFDFDIVSGYPTVIAGNAGPASVRSFEVEVKRTPKRYIFMVVRPKKELLDKMMVSKEKVLIK